MAKGGFRRFRLHRARRPLTRTLTALIFWNSRQSLLDVHSTPRPCWFLPKTMKISNEHIETFVCIDLNSEHGKGTCTCPRHLTAKHVQECEKIITYLARGTCHFTAHPRLKVTPNCTRTKKDIKKATHETTHIEEELEICPSRDKKRANMHICLLLRFQSFHGGNRNDGTQRL